MNHKSRIPIEAFLANLPLFKGFAHDQIRRLSADVVQIDAPRGTTIFGRGDPCCGIYFVVFGQVKLALHAEQGTEKVLELAGAGQSLAEETMFLDKPYGASAETLVDTKLVHLAKASVLAELERNSAFARGFIGKLCRRLDYVIGDIESYTLRSGTQRVAGYLLSHLHERSDAQDNAIRLPASKGIIASKLNLTHEHFSRILHDLSTSGLIEVDGREIAIRDLERLRARTAA
jgi:CRP-like cAMP-binding protein